MKEESDYAISRLSKISFHPSNSEDLKKMVNNTQEVMRSINSLIVYSGYWAKPYCYNAIIQTIKKTVFWANKPENGADENKLLPSLMLVYGVGIAALCSRNYSLFRELFFPTLKHYNEDRSLPYIVNNNIIDWDFLRIAYGGSYNQPMSDLIFNYLFDFYEELGIDKSEFESVFDTFELIWSLAVLRNPTNDPHRIRHFNLGRFWSKDLSLRITKSPKQILWDSINEKADSHFLVDYGIFPTFKELKTTMAFFDSKYKTFASN